MYKKIFKNQVWHLISIIIAVIVLQVIINCDEGIIGGSLFGVSTNRWFWIAILIPIIHQIYVFIVWRLELYTRIFTRKFGLKKAFKIYAAGFSILFVLRFITVIVLAFSNRKTLDINPIYMHIIAVVITPFVIYLFYSVKKYFTFERAFGIDHFDKGYDVPYVKKGIFRYTNNGMYIFGLAILYLPGLLLLSKAAILVAFFNHVYIWVHYYTVELPDMRYIYKKIPKE
ncbi:phosphatidylethanolamine N-methyltransferase family protein [Fusobacteria bacterium ZRK30]|nr:phosphatidylethanolamine N-methyltransferase family protein [Fusobacteria bacterium ZRK30]